MFERLLLSQPHFVVSIDEEDVLEILLQNL
jgi:hypothetical protein